MEQCRAHRRGDGAAIENPLAPRNEADGADDHGAAEEAARMAAEKQRLEAALRGLLADDVGEVDRDELVRLEVQIVDPLLCVLAGLPGLSLPCGLSDGMPVGLQLAERQGVPPTPVR